MLFKNVLHRPVLNHLEQLWKKFKIIKIFENNLIKKKPKFYLWHSLDPHLLRSHMSQLT